LTKVQEKTLAGAKGKASLKKDKELGATKMTKRNNTMAKTMKKAEYGTAMGPKKPCSRA